MRIYKKVIHFTTVHTTFDQRIFHRECISLSHAGFETILLSFGDIDGKRHNVKLIGLGVGQSRKKGMTLINRALRIYKILKVALKLNADIYHFHDPELIIAGIILKFRTNAQVIYDCHEDNVAYMRQKKYIPYPFRWALSFLIQFSEWFAGHFLDAVITADEGMKTYFQSIGARAVKVDNFPRLDYFIGKAEDVLPEFDLVYHGTIPKYHLETCFAVDREMVNRGLSPTWLFIGKCADLSWAKEQLKKNNTENRFTFKGMVPHEEIAQWVRLGSIGIIPLPDFPKFHRNMPTKLFEFMALKLPVVLSDLPPSRPFVGDGQCAIMVDPNSPKEYADAIELLMINPHLRTKMGEEGHKRVINSYNWDNSFVAMHDLYKELLCTNS